ncbi:MAG: hypothetical protein M0Z63_09030, partial [Actinomycetota bacterium]|nr:hypothetical protein [Actinomycetota bacterium]
MAVVTDVIAVAVVSAVAVVRWRTADGGTGKPTAAAASEGGDDRGALLVGVVGTPDRIVELLAQVGDLAFGLVRSELTLVLDVRQLGLCDGSFGAAHLELVAELVLGG